MAKKSKTSKSPYVILIGAGQVAKQLGVSRWTAGRAMERMPHLVYLADDRKVMRPGDVPKLKKVIPLLATKKARRRKSG